MVVPSYILWTRSGGRGRGRGLGFIPQDSRVCGVSAHRGSADVRARGWSRDRVSHGAQAAPIRTTAGGTLFYRRQVNGYARGVPREMRRVARWTPSMRSFAALVHTCVMWKNMRRDHAILQPTAPSASPPPSNAALFSRLAETMLKNCSRKRANGSSTVRSQFPAKCARWWLPCGGLPQRQTPPVTRFSPAWLLATTIRALLTCSCCPRRRTVTAGRQQISAAMSCLPCPPSEILDDALGT